MIAILPTLLEMTSRRTDNWFSTLTQPRQLRHGENYKQVQEKEEEATEDDEPTEEEEGKKDDVFTKMLSCPCSLIVSSSTRLVSSSLLKSPTSSKGLNEKKNLHQHVSVSVTEPLSK